MSDKKVSSCCGAEDKPAGEDGPNYSDIDSCPACHEHCVFEADSEEME